MKSKPAIKHRKFHMWMDKVKSKLTWLQGWVEDIFSSKKKTFLFLGLLVFTSLFVIQVLIILINNSFYNNFSDDIIQYYSIINDFITQVKDGTISWFNLNNYLGASFFSDIYYIPLDIFTFITFLLSYVMPVELAYSSTELIKIFAGVMVFAYYLHLQGMKNRTIFWMGIVYFINGGTVSFMVFPVFLSLTFYLPLSLIIIYLFNHKKYWVVPLFSLAVVFYDFYLGYMALAFISIMFIVEYFKRPGFNFFRFIRDGAIFLGLLLLGVVMSLVILYPSILYILEDTYRATGSFDAWVVKIGSYDLKLFKPTMYIRVLAKIFAEQKGIGFYGFENNYGTEHASLFISVIGFAYMTYIYFMKGRVARVYKILIPISMIMIILPIFSYVFSGTTDAPYTRWINVYPIVEVMILAHVFDEFGFEKVKMYKLTIPVVLMLALVGFLIKYYIDKLATDADFWSRDVLTADTILMGISAGILLLLLIFGWMRKYWGIKFLFWAEVIIAMVYIYSGPFAIPNKIKTFETMHSINTFLNENLDQDQFYRVYVDISRFDVEMSNFNRMTTFATNTRIFHSWTDSETNAISLLVFNANEYQTKTVLEVQSIYLNQFLGYRYVLVNAQYNYYLPSTYFELKAEDEQFRLYEILNASPFSVYESYNSYQDFISFRNNSNTLTVQKALLDSAILDTEDTRFDESNINLAEGNLVSSYGNEVIYGFQAMNHATLVETSGITNTTSRSFYKYTNPDFYVGFNAGAVYIRSTYMSVSSYGEMFVEFADGSRKSCEIQDTTDHQIKCEFWSEPTAIYFEKTAGFNDVKTLQYRLECAINAAAYLVYDLSKISFASSGGMMYSKLNLNVEFEKVFVVDASGVETQGFKNFLYFNSAPVRMYVFKTAAMYELPNLFNLQIQYNYDDLSYYGEHSVSTIADNQYLTIENGNIHLRYTRTSDSTYDQLVVIPTAYSEEWVITSGQDYETISASGGFLGILIPYTVTDIDITLKFVPKGLKQGSLATLGGVAVYAGIFVPIALVNRRRKKNKMSDLELINHEEDNNHHSVV